MGWNRPRVRRWDGSQHRGQVGGGGRGKGEGRDIRGEKVAAGISGTVRV